MTNVQDRMTIAGKALFAAKKKKAKLEADLKLVNASITELETVTLAKLMEDSDVEKFTVKGMGTVYLAQEVYVSVLAEDRPKLYEALRAGNNGALVVDWVFPQTLKAFAKEQLTNGKPLPDVVKATFIPTARTRSK